VDAHKRYVLIGIHKCEWFVKRQPMWKHKWMMIKKNVVREYDFNKNMNINGHYNKHHHRLDSPVWPSSLLQVDQSSYSFFRFCDKLFFGVGLSTLCQSPAILEIQCFSDLAVFTLPRDHLSRNIWHLGPHATHLVPLQ
jgi:hypothetical protein